MSRPPIAAVAFWTDDEGRDTMRQPIAAGLPTSRSAVMDRLWRDGWGNPDSLTVMHPSRVCWPISRAVHDILWALAAGRGQVSDPDCLDDPGVGESLAGLGYEVHGNWDWWSPLWIGPADGCTCHDHMWFVPKRPWR